MARLGFNIGRALNIGARFAVGAGAFDKLGGAGGDLLETAGDIVGGEQRAGAGATLSERLRGGFSAVSPQFAQAENIRSAIEARGVGTEIDRGKLEQQRADAESVSIEGIMPGLSPETRKLAIEDLRQAGLIERDTEGNETVRRGAMRKELEAFNTDPVRQRRLVQSEVNSSVNQLKKMNVRVNTLMEKELQKVARERGLDFKAMSDKSKQELKAELVEKFQADPSQNPEANTLQQEAMKLFEQKEQWEDRLDNLDAVTTTPLQESQIALNEARTKAALDPSDGSFDAGDYSKLANSDDPKLRQLAQDALKFKRKPEGEARRDIVFKTIATSLTGEEGLQRRAQKSAGSIPRLNKMIELVDTGKVTGKGGQIKAGVAAWAELLGMSEKDLKSQGYSDSQLFQQLGRLIVGPLRTEIIGPGQVTDNEQNILVKAGGAGGLTGPAAKELLQEYIIQNQNNIDFYNENVDSLIELDSQAGKAFKHINAGDRQRGLSNISPTTPTTPVESSGGNTVDSFIESLGGIQ